MLSLANGEASNYRVNPAGTRNFNAKRGAALGGLRPHPHSLFRLQVFRCCFFGNIVLAFLFKEFDGLFVSLI